MSDTLDHIVPSLYAATRQGIIPIGCDYGEMEAFPFLLNGTCVSGLLADAKGVLLAAATRGRGVLATRDGGRSWAAAAGLGSEEVRVLAGEGSRVLAVAGNAALHLSEDRGASFKALPSVEGLVREGAGDATPVITSAVLAGERVILGFDPGGLLRSQDGGRSFVRLKGDLPASVLSLLRVGSGDGLLVGTREGLYLGAAGGTWRRVLAHRVRKAITSVAVDPSRPDRLLVGASETVTLAKPARPTGANSRLLGSADGGETWTEVDRELLPVVRGWTSVIRFVPRDPARVFAGITSGEILESRDGGASWQVGTASLPGVLALEVGPALAG